VCKTTLINAIQRILAAKKLRILPLCTPTGWAARRMRESPGLEAKTIHRLLEFDPAAHAFKRNGRQRRNAVASSTRSSSSDEG
jgi:exodeoxyribonuclease V alpha subunit